MLSKRNSQPELVWFFMGLGSACTARQVEWMKENADGSSKPGFPKFGELDKVTVDGEKATAQVDTKRGWRPIEFRKVDGIGLSIFPKTHHPQVRSKTTVLPESGRYRLATRNINCVRPRPARQKMPSTSRAQYS